MKLTFLSAAFLLLVACGKAQPGPAPQGGLPIRVLAWGDATGSTLGTGPVPTYVDPHGLIWQLDPETGLIANPRSKQFYYPSTDCSGPGYADVSSLGYGPVLPRVPFMLTIDPPIKWAVRADDAKSGPAPSRIQSVWDGRHCTPSNDQGFRMFPLPATTIQAPSLPFATPFHQEEL